MPDYFQIWEQIKQNSHNLIKFYIKNSYITPLENHKRERYKLHMCKFRQRGKSSTPYVAAWLANDNGVPISFFIPKPNDSLDIS